MLDHITLCSLLILIFVNGLVSYDLHHKRQMGATNEKDQMLQENEDLTKAEENLNSNFFEGDILTTPEQMKRINRLLFHYHDTTNSVDRPDVRGLVKDVRKTWPNGIVYYKISNLLGPDRKRLIKNAIKHWKQRTCLKFKKRTNENDYIRFQFGFGCASFVGRIGGRQRLVVGQQCKLGNIIHEVGHAIGFFHEMARPDRDEFVKIVWKNIVPRFRRNFLKFTTKTIDSRNIPYDYNSIMHYSRLHFTKSRNGMSETVVPTKDSSAQIGQRLGLSVLDVKQAKLLYNCGTGQGQNTMIPDGDMDAAH